MRGVTTAGAIVALLLHGTVHSYDVRSSGNTKTQNDWGEVYRGEDMFARTSSSAGRAFDGRKRKGGQSMTRKLSANIFDIAKRGAGKKGKKGKKSSKGSTGSTGSTGDTGPGGIGDQINTNTLAPSISIVPSTSPSVSASPSISSQPSTSPSSQPSSSPTASPSDYPSSAPTATPSISPSISMFPTRTPSSNPSASPTDSPSASPSSKPSSTPSRSPSDFPSLLPSVSPSISTHPSSRPSLSSFPSLEPSNLPTIDPASATTSTSFLPDQSLFSECRDSATTPEEEQDNRIILFTYDMYLLKNESNNQTSADPLDVLEKVEDNIHYQLVKNYLICRLSSTRYRMLQDDSSSPSSLIPFQISSAPPDTLSTEPCSVENSNDNDCHRVKAGLSMSFLQSGGVTNAKLRTLEPLIRENLDKEANLSPSIERLEFVGFDNLSDDNENDSKPDGGTAATSIKDDGGHKKRSIVKAVVATAASFGVLLLCFVLVRRRKDNMKVKGWDKMDDSTRDLAFNTMILDDNKSNQTELVMDNGSLGPDDDSLFVFDREETDDSQQQNRSFVSQQQDNQSILSNQDKSIVMFNNWSQDHRYEKPPGAFEYPADEMQIKVKQDKCIDQTCQNLQNQCNLFSKAEVKAILTELGPEKTPKLQGYRVYEAPDTVVL